MSTLRDRKFRKLLIIGFVLQLGGFLTDRFTRNLDPITFLLVASGVACFLVGLFKYHVPDLEEEMRLQNDSQTSNFDKEKEPTKT